LGSLRGTSDGPRWYLGGFRSRISEIEEEYPELVEEVSHIVVCCLAIFPVAKSRTRPEAVEERLPGAWIGGGSADRFPSAITVPPGRTLTARFHCATSYTRARRHWYTPRRRPRRSWVDGALRLGRVTETQIPGGQTASQSQQSTRPATG